MRKMVNPDLVLDLDIGGDIESAIETWKTSIVSVGRKESEPSDSSTPGNQIEYA